MHPTHHLVIIGNGIAGVTLAQQMRAHNATCRITLVSSESATHFSRPALMYVYMGHMQFKDIVPYPDWYWQEQQLTQVQDRVAAVDFEQKQLVLQQGEPLPYDVLVIATGSCPAFYNWPGQGLHGVQGLVTLQDLELMEQNTQGVKSAVVIGGGLIGIEMAEMLRSRGHSVTMLIRDSLFWQSNLPEQEAQLVTQLIASHGIAVVAEDEVEEFVADPAGKLQKIITKKGRELPCQFAGVATGVKPNIAFLLNSELETNTGVLVNPYFETNIRDVYAIGDCAQFREAGPAAPAIEQLWYTARLHGLALAKTLSGDRLPYDRGPWFNSAKFLDIEYQTYGFVPSKWTSAYDSVYWEHPQKQKAIRLFYELESAKLLGINLLGIRYRHDLCHHWLKSGYTIHEVMPELAAANFDPEFFQQYERALLSEYYRRFPAQAPHQTQPDWWNLRKRFNLFSNTVNC